MIMSPTIYGRGLGQYNRISIQVPWQIRSAIKEGQAEVIGEGKGVWDFVHVEDLADLYVILLKRVLAGEEIPSGEKGLLFSSSGRFSWLEAAQAIGKALFRLGKIGTDKVKEISLEEADRKWVGGDVRLAELGFASK